MGGGGAAELGRRERLLHAERRPKAHLRSAAAVEARAAEANREASGGRRGGGAHTVDDRRHALGESGEGVRGIRRPVVADVGLTQVGADDGAAAIEHVGAHDERRAAGDAQRRGGADVGGRRALDLVGRRRRHLARTDDGVDVLFEEELHTRRLRRRAEATAAEDELDAARRRAHRRHAGRVGAFHRRDVELACDGEVARRRLCGVAVRRDVHDNGRGVGRRARRHRARDVREVRRHHRARRAATDGDGGRRRAAEALTSQGEVLARPKDGRTCRMEERRLRLDDAARPLPRREP